MTNVTQPYTCDCQYFHTAARHVFGAYLGLIIVVIVIYSVKLSNISHTKYKYKKQRNRTMTND